MRSSFTKAFSRNAKISKTAKHSSLSHLSSSSQEHGSITGDHHTIREGSNENSLENSHEILNDISSKADKSEDASKTEGATVNGNGETIGILFLNIHNLLLQHNSFLYF